MKGFPGLYQRGKNYWIDVRINGRRYQESLGTTNGEVACKRYVERRREIELGVDRQESNRTALEWLVLYRRAMQGKNEPHKNEVVRINRAFIEHSRAEQPSGLDSDEALEWLLAYTGISARSRAKYARHLKAFGNFLLKHKKRSKVTENPFAALEFTWGEHDRVYLRRHFKVAGLFKLFESCPPYRGVVYLAAAFTGLRRSELGQLLWEDVNLEEFWIHLRATTTKNKKRRKQHPIPETLARLLAALKAGEVSLADASGRVHAYSKAKTGPQDRVFVCIPGTETLRRDLAAAGVEHETPAGVLDFHSLRGAFATLLEAHKVGLSTAQKLMRHSDPRLTANVYQDLEFSELKTALDTVADTATRLGSVVKIVGTLRDPQPSTEGYGRNRIQQPVAPADASPMNIGGAYSQSKRATMLFAWPSGFEDRGRHQPTLGPSLTLLGHILPQGCRLATGLARAAGQGG